MGLQGCCDKEESLQTWEEVRDYAARKDAHVRWQPCTPRMRVSDDRFIETEDRERIYVSNRGWAALCRALGCDLSTMQGIGAPGLATKVLNDAWSQRAENMMGRRIVVDGWTVVGIVGSRYQPYKHGRLLTAIDGLMNESGSSRWSDVANAWKEIQANGAIARTIGTELRITLPLRRHVHQTRVQGPGGESPDASWIGVEARNGLSGECSVSVRTTVHRLVCANGMVRHAAECNQRVSHTGAREALDTAVSRILGTATAGLDGTLAWLQRLGNCRFEAKALARDGESMGLVMRMLADLHRGGYWKRRLTRARRNGRLPEEIQCMARKMAGPLSGAVWLSTYRSNATWWDFLNIFTEAAQSSRDLARQMRVEEQAGRLAERWAKAKNGARP